MNCQRVRDIKELQKPGVIEIRVVKKWISKGKKKELCYQFVSGTIRNCCFEAENQLQNLLLISEFLWPALLLPVAGNKIYSEQDTSKMPLELASALSIEREPVTDPEIRIKCSMPFTCSPYRILLSGPLRTGMDLKTGIETAGDSTQMGVRVDMVGTQFGVGPRGVPMPANIRVSYSTARRVYVEGVTSNCIRQSSENSLCPCNLGLVHFPICAVVSLVNFLTSFLRRFTCRSKLPGNQMFLDADSQNIIDGIRSTLLPKGDGMILTTKRAMKESPASVVLMAYCFISFSPVSNKHQSTTYENFRYRSDNRINVYHRCCLNNFLEVFCTKVQPSKNDFRAFVTDDQPQRPPMHNPRDADLEDNNNNTGDNRRMKVEDDMDIGGDLLKISQRHNIEDIEADICSCTCQGLQQILDSGKALPFADGVLINGQGRASFSGDQGVQYKRDKVVLVMVKSMKNPRSALIKTSIMVSSDIFKAFGVKLFDSTSDSINQLLLQLLLKACQDKKFVCEEAERALLAMVEAMAPLPLLQKLSAYVGHSNLKDRAKAAIFISKCELDRKVKCVSFIDKKWDERVTL
ncbi:hypothetical protein CASFOL_001611 [Castilleja foliolosa]|uniref:Protein HGH1 N-terminal domain-containing protein n=1 Tax=Castilleja foliolosa TaxID=1961234 RepID=A0ABD3EMZ0_9LAMI